MVLGISLGFFAALLQAVSYLCSAHFISRYRTGAITHLIFVHLLLGLASVLLLPLFWHPQLLQPATYFPTLVGMTVFYLFGQFSLYQAIRHSEPSRVSPLLGLKVPMLAVAGVLALGDSYAPVQWGAVLLCGLGAIWLGRSGGPIAPGALLWILGACSGYALSDIFVTDLTRSFSTLPLMQAATLSVCLCYGLCGLACLLWLPRLSQRQHFWKSLPAASTWLGANVCLFGCFALIGVVYGGVVQSSRGLTSILLGVLVASLGFRFAEPLPPWRVLGQRLAAAGLMLCAIALFSLGAARAT